MTGGEKGALIPGLDTELCWSIDLIYDFRFHDSFTAPWGIASAGRAILASTVGRYGSLCRTRRPASRDFRLYGSTVQAELPRTPGSLPARHAPNNNRTMER